MRPGASTGPAPHARGILVQDISQTAGDRISPAYAGNTLYGAASPPSRGGSAPHVRGIPARSASQRSAKGGQPRLRGEYLLQTKGFLCKGSAPLARGIRPDPRSRCTAGVSPACAGNTGEMQTVVPGTRGQPRLRGEYSAGMVAGSSTVGSAPLARGIRPLPRLAGCAGRVSPACAGNTSASVGEKSCWRGQPRLRGEYTVSNGVIPPFINANASFFLRFALHLSCRERRPSRPRPRHGMRHRSGGWMPAFRHASAMQRSVSVRSCDAGTLRNPWANASRTAFADQPCSTARMAIP